MEKLNIMQPLLTCFSNQLLKRLYKSDNTVEALLGVAFKWEPPIHFCSSGSFCTNFQPHYRWFCNKFLSKSPLLRLFNQGVGFVRFDEAWTLHPLIFSTLIQTAHEHGVMTLSAGELQISACVEAQWLAKGWHTCHGFHMLPWHNLHNTGQVL